MLWCWLLAWWPSIRSRGATLCYGRGFRRARACKPAERSFLYAWLSMFTISKATRAFTSLTLPLAVWTYTPALPTNVTADSTLVFQWFPMGVFNKKLIVSYLLLIAITSSSFTTSVHRLLCNGSGATTKASYLQTFAFEVLIASPSCYPRGSWFISLRTMWMTSPRLVSSRR